MSKKILGVLGGVVGVAAFLALFLALQGKSVSQVQVGSVASPDLSSPYISVAGVRHEFRQGKWTSIPASGVACILQSPSATSTLEWAAASITTASSTATTWQFAKATTSDATVGASFATATKIAGYSLGSGAVGTLFPTATSTGATAPTVDDTLVFGPNQALALKVFGTVIADSTKLNGVCSADFTVVNY